MRHLLALLTLAFVLVACDDEATTAPVDTIPGPPNAPYLKVTVLTGTKAAPVDSPTVKVEWKYKDSVDIVMAAAVNSNGTPIGMNPEYIKQSNRPIGDTTIRIGCYARDSVYYTFLAVYLDKISSDTLKVYCK